MRMICCWHITHIRTTEFSIVAYDPGVAGSAIPLCFLGYVSLDSSL